MKGKFEPGDLVVVKKPPSGEPFHTSDGGVYTKECWPGARGTLEKIIVNHSSETPIWSIAWDLSQEVPEDATEVWKRGSNRAKTSWIDETCLELLVDETYVFKSLGGITPHCDTCTCFEED